MKTRMYLCVAILLASNALAQDIHESWKDRAVQAEKKIGQLRERLERTDNLKTRLELMVENAYAAIAAAPETTIKRDDRITAYHYILNFGADGVLNVVYIYDTATRAQLGVRVDRIPRNRGIALTIDRQSIDFFGLINNENPKEPRIVFNKTNPFVVTVSSD